MPRSDQYSKVAMILKGAFLFSRNPQNNGLDPAERFVLHSSCLGYQTRCKLPRASVKLIKRSRFRQLLTDDNNRHRLKSRKKEMECHFSFFSFVFKFSNLNCCFIVFSEDVVFYHFCDVFFFRKKKFAL